MTKLENLTWDEVGSWLLTDGLKVLTTILIAVVVRWLLHRAIDRVVRTTTAKSAQRLASRTRAGRAFANATGLAHERHTQRSLTMGSMLRSVVTFVVATLTLLTVLGLVGIPLAPLLTSAGVGGIALGFGAQSLVKDFLSGIFMILEDQYGVGDVIDSGEVIGTVEEVSLRVTRLRDFNGVVWYVRNGEIIRIGNRTQGWSTALVDLPVAFDEDLDAVLPVIREVVHTMDEDEEWRDRLLEEPEVVGVESVGPGVVTIRIVAKCAPDSSVPVAREIRGRALRALAAANIHTPGTPPPPIGLGPMGPGPGGAGAPGGTAGTGGPGS